jgi:ribosome-associated protein
MDIRKLQRAIVDGLEDVKAHDIRVFNTEHLSPLFERVIVASGTSNRQTKALASSVRDNVKRRCQDVMPRTEGEENGEWIIVDCGAAVAHIMQPAVRQYYNLEEIWGDKAVRLKLGPDGASHKAAVASKTPAATTAAKGAAKKAAARKLPAGKAPAKKASPGKAGSARAPASKTPARQASAPPRKAAAAAKKAGPPARKTPRRAAR